jgi:hypothetical protein
MDASSVTRVLCNLDMKGHTKRWPTARALSSDTREAVCSACCGDESSPTELVRGFERPPGPTAGIFCDGVSTVDTFMSFE